MNITTLGIDIAKNVFQLFGVNAQGEQVLSKRLTRKKLPEFLAQLPKCTVAMEACGSSNYWARLAMSSGHEIKMISPQYVKPFVKRNKNDARDAEGIVIASLNKQMHFVLPKTIEQQDMQSILVIRAGLIKHRTSIVNQIRGRLAEYGCTIHKGLSALRGALPDLIDPGQENLLTPLVKRLISQLYELLKKYDEQILEVDRMLKAIPKQNKTCRELMEIEGVGVIAAVAIVSLAGYGAGCFKNGRHFAAFLGLVPKQHSSGERHFLQGISKRGNSYLRQILIHGARSVLRRVGEKEDSRNRWLRGVCARAGMNRAAVALANKNARIAMAMLLRGESYRKAS